MKYKVYIASPYTVGLQAENVRFQMDVFNELRDEGLIPFIPLLTHFQHMVHPRGYEDWMEYDFEWVKACDFLLRLGGESPGGDREVELAHECGIPVFYNIVDLLAYVQEKEGAI